MRRNTLSTTAMLALMVGAGGNVERLAPPARDGKPERPVRFLRGGNWIPFPHLTHVSRETLNKVADGIAWPCEIRADRRARRKARMRLRKRRGWR